MIILIAIAVAAAALVGFWFLVRRRRAVDSISPPRRIVSTRLGRLFSGRIDDQFWSALEEDLLAADVGVEATTQIISSAREARPSTPDEARDSVRTALLHVFVGADRRLGASDPPRVIIVVGVNGSGKTTTVAKLASRMLADGEQVLVVAGDTYRAAAADQLERWSERLGFDLVRGSEGADPASVVFDGVSAGRARGIETVIVDTAGRLHSNQNLMDELTKIVTVARREGGSVDEVLLVLDGTAGQNSITQAREFTDAVGVTGVIVTKLDGSARGGAVVAVEGTLGVPLKLVGIGEGADDLLHFSPERFVDELLSTS